MLSRVWVWDTLDCSLPGSSVHGIFQVKILEWVVIYSFSGFSRAKDQTWVSCASCIAGGFFYPWDIGEALEYIWYVYFIK